ncbi:MAG: Ig-like domain-containing protein [Deltaproteobacteria bacterium]
MRNFKVIFFLVFLFVLLSVSFTVTASAESSKVNYHEKILLGDINQDGNINTLDKELLNNAIEGTLKLTLKQQFVADLNFDSLINQADITKLDSIIQNVSSTGSIPQELFNGVLYGALENYETIGKADSDLLMNYIAGKEKFTFRRQLAADLNTDNTIDMPDAIILSTYLKGLSLKISNISPQDGEKKVNVKTKIYVNFSKDIEINTESKANIIIRDANYKSNFTCDFLKTGDREITIETTSEKYPHLDYDTTYTCTIEKGCIKDYEGNLNEAYTFSFTTEADLSADTTSPYVLKTTPANGEKLISELSDITVQYSEPITYSSYGLYSAWIKSQDGSKLGVSGKLDGSKFIIPAKDLNPGTLYTIEIVSGAFKDNSGNKTSVYSFTFTTPGQKDTTPPTVLKTTPSNGTAVYAPEVWEIIIEYSEPIIYSTNYIQRKKFISVESSDGDIYGSDKIDGSKLIITLKEGVKPSKSYQVKIGSDELKDNSGNKASAYSFSFTTSAEKDTTPPTLLKSTPSNGAKNVNIKTDISLSFSENVIINEKANTDVIIKSKGNNAWTCFLTKNSDNTIKVAAISDKYPQFDYNTEYTCTIQKGCIKDSYGNVNEEYTFSFTTETEKDITSPTILTTTPANKEILTSELSKIIVEYSEPIQNSKDVYFAGGNPVWIKAQDGSSQPAIAKINDSILTIAVSDLKPRTLYTVEIAGSAFSDKANNKTSAYSFSFTTAAEAPVVPPVTPPVSTINFSDLLANHWAYKAVSEMTAKKIINGFTDGTFRPNATVTREQFATMMVRALNLPITEPKTPTFKDMNSKHWAYKYVESAKSYLTGYKKSDGTYYYKGSINATREDMAYALVKAKGLENQAADIAKLSTIFKDANKISPVLRKYVLIAYENNIISGYTDNTFRPAGALTRAEAAALLYNATMQQEDTTDEKVIMD